MNANDLKLVYEQLKGRYPLTFTNTLAVDDGFTTDAPIIVGSANGVSFWLYEDGGEFVFSVEVPGQPYHDHWHPQNVEEAVRNVIGFMEDNVHL